MAVYEIPIDANSGAFFRKRVALDGSDYWLDFAYNQRCDCWYMSIFAGSAGETPVVQSIKLVSNRPLLHRYRHRAVPPGEFMAVDTKEAVAAAGLTQLGQTIKLLYLDAAEVAAASG